MAIEHTPRLGLTQWTDPGLTDPVHPDQFNADAAALDDLAAIATQGLAADRPASGVRGRFYYATDTGVLSYDTGFVWASLPASADPLNVNIGDPFMGGYFAGIIDTTQGNIIAADASQTGLRYALIVSPVTFEAARKYKTADTAAPGAARTRWDGLSATQAMNDAAYPAAQYCAGLSYPSDEASPWYLPAMDELELIYRNLKATTESNHVATRTGHEFPGGSQGVGYNPSADPAGAAYTATVPGQTSVTVFRDGGGQDLGDAGTNHYYWSATEAAASLAWFQIFSGSIAGTQNSYTKTSSYRVRPVRRLVLPAG